MDARKRRSHRSGRAPLRSPERPPVAGRSELRQFWLGIAGGMTSENAALTAGMSQPVGTKLFRKAGGMPPAMFRSSAKPLSGRYLSFAEREEIALLRVQGHSMREIGRRLSRFASTISRELRRDAATRSGGLDYRASTAQWHAERSGRRPKTAKLALNPTLRTYVEERLGGIVAAPRGVCISGPTVSWNGRRHGQRKDRRWALAWSPEQIARRLDIDFPNDETMRISHKSIYQALFIQSRGALRRELTACLRTGRALRTPRARVGRRGKGFVSPEIMISQRPAEAADREIPGHWEGDLILGLGSSTIGTLVERTTRFTVTLRHIIPEDAEALGEMVRRSDARDVEMRFFRAFNALPSGVAEELCRLDPTRDSATVAVTDDREIVGVGRLAIMPNEAAAECAVMVRSDMRRRGLGRALMAALVEDAQGMGLRRIHGHVHQENKPMLDLATKVSFRSKAQIDDPMLMVIELEMTA